METADKVCMKWNMIDSCQMAWFKLRIKLAKRNEELSIYSSLKARPNVMEELEGEGYRIVILESMYESWTWISW